MGKYCLHRDISIRSYTNAAFVTYRKCKRETRRITAREFCVLNACDGVTELDDDSAIVKKFLEHGYIRKCTGLTEPVPVDYLRCGNRMMTYMTLEITERCNFNCLHCFNAADTGVSHNEMPFEKVCSLLDQAHECGVFSILLTGGEPLIHPDFMKIMKAIYDRGMTVYELNTNGFFLTGELLRTMRSYGMNPVIKISFDGIGTHDLIRNFRGCEERTLNAIRMAIEEGFKVAINMNMNRLNEHTVLPSLFLLSEYGVKKVRIIRTTESPRWAMLGKDATLPWSEYYEKTLDICRECVKRGLELELEIWNFLYLFPKSKMYECHHIKQCGERMNSDAPLCRCTARNIAIEADGSAVPCMEMSGALKAAGSDLGNAFEMPLHDLLDETSRYSRAAGASLSEKMRRNSMCAGCPYFSYCGGGCTAMGIIYDKDYFGTDHTACIFFRDHWPAKIRESLPGWKCSRDIPEIDDGGYLDSVSGEIKTGFVFEHLDVPGE